MTSEVPSDPEILCFIDCGRREELWETENASLVQGSSSLLPLALFLFLWTVPCSRKPDLGIPHILQNTSHSLGGTGGQFHNLLLTLILERT